MKSLASEPDLSLQKNKDSTNQFGTIQEKRSQSLIYLLCFHYFFKKISIMFGGYRNNRFLPYKSLYLCYCSKDNRPTQYCSRQVF